MMRRLLGCALVWAMGCLAADAPVDIKFDRFQLKNGLTVLVHEDRKAPVVAINIWYHVGSKNEKLGKTGFAHLFEHLMFNGSENFNDDYFKVLEKLGASDMNGTTNVDRTNYFQNVPTSTVDTVLWMESDRMGHLVGAIDQKRLDEQRGVVQNEKRQGENQPYGIDFELISENTYPKGHPYSWETIGSMEDLNAASLNDVKDWFKTYYGPSNAVLVLAGDIDLKTAREKVEKYFGALPPGPPVAKQERWIAKMTGEHRTLVQERVPQPRIYKIWNTPEIGSKEDMAFDMIADIMGGGKTSRLYKRLVYQDQVATEVAAFEYSKEIGSQFFLQITAKPGTDMSKVEAAMDEEMKRFLAEGPTEQELQQAKAKFVSGFVRGSERIGGFGGKSDVLATYEVFTGNASNYKRTLDFKQNVTAAELKQIANRWLSDGVYVLSVVPFPEFQPAGKDADRSKVPEVGPAPGLRLPSLQRLTLSNGLKVLLAERHETPLVEMTVMMESGYAADQSAVPGTASLTMAMMSEGTAKRSAEQINNELALLGSDVSERCGLDFCYVQLNSLKSKMGPALDLFADILLHPSFPQKELERLKKERIAGIQAEKSDPQQAGFRVVSAVVFGKGHPYSTWGGSGTEESVAKIDRNTLVQFHQNWFKPNRATLVVVGDTTVAELKAQLEKLFADWKPGEPPKKQIPQVPVREKSVVYLVDKPGAQQSVIVTANLAPAFKAEDQVANDVMNAALGGQFTSRLNMNLREDKHWSYGAFSFLRNTQGQRIYVTMAPVQTDKTKESLVEVIKELRDYVREKPITDQELAMAKSNLTASLPGSLETLNALNGKLQELVAHQLPDDYHLQYGPRVQALTRQQVMAAAERVLRPEGLVWVVVGDRAKIEEDVKKLGLGTVQVVDADGNPVASAIGGGQQ